MPKKLLTGELLFEQTFKKIGVPLFEFLELLDVLLLRIDVSFELLVALFGLGTLFGRLFIYRRLTLFDFLSRRIGIGLSRCNKRYERST